MFALECARARLLALLSGGSFGAGLGRPGLQAGAKGEEKGAGKQQKSPWVRSQVDPASCRLVPPSPPLSVLP